MKKKKRKLVPRNCVICKMEFVGRADSPGITCSLKCRNVLGGKSVLGISKNAGSDNGNYIDGQRSLAARAWAKRYPEKFRAEQILLAAVKNGSVVRQPCEICGAQKTHAHHDDYSKPLEVIWLCPKHHKARHRELYAKAAR